MARPKTVETCYACDEPATTKEHVPPKSFFPEAHRDNLITVPSCALHNNANSLDVEYARNIISTSHGVNGVGQRHFIDKAMRSFDRRPAMVQTTFPRIRPVMFRGRQVGVFEPDIDRINAVMSACVTALHFLETSEKEQRWEIVLPNMGFSSRNTSQEQIDAWRQVLLHCSQLSWKSRPVNSPEVFRYSVANLEGHRMYAMEFYAAFLVLGLTAVEVAMGQSE